MQVQVKPTFYQSFGKINFMEILIKKSLPLEDTKILLTLCLPGKKT